MLLCDAKRDAIIQWHNAVTLASNNISSLSQLQDGCILERHVKETFLGCSEGAVATSSKQVHFFKEADARARFATVRKYIDASCHVSSEELVSYKECMDGVELEIAKVSVLTLCITVTQLLRRADDPRLCLLYQLDAPIQQEIRECMTFVMDNEELRKADFNRILVRSVTVHERLARVSCAGPATPAKAATPRARGRPRKFADYETSFSDEGPRTLLQMMESPKVKAWSTMAWMEREVLNLRAALEVADNKIIDQRILVGNLEIELSKKKEEVEQLKQKSRALQEELDARDPTPEQPTEAPAAPSRSKVVEGYETEIAILKKELDSLRDNTDDLSAKLERYREKEAGARERLAEGEARLRLAEAERESRAAEAERLAEENRELRDALAVCQDKLQERDREYESKLMEYSSGEIVGDILEEDRRATRERLLQEELAGARLRRLLDEKTSLCERQQARLKSLESVPDRPASGRIWADCRGEGGNPPPSDSDKGEEDRSAASAMNEILRLAERAFAAHGDAPVPEPPATGGGFAEDAERTKRLLRGLSGRSRPARAKGERFETKSDEASLDSGMCAASDPGSGPSSGEEGTRRPDALGPVDPLRELYEEALRAKEECEQRNRELSSEVAALAGSLGEASGRLERCERRLVESEAHGKLYAKKYAKLKAYVVKTEDEERERNERWRLCRDELRSLREQVLLLRAEEKELRLAAARHRESRDELSAQLDVQQHRSEQLEREREELRGELEAARMQCKQLALDNEELKRRREWGCEVEYSGNEKVAAGPCFKMRAVFPAAGGDEGGTADRGGDESVLSGNPFNMSLHSTLIAEDEDLFVHHTGLPPREDSFSEQLRLRELRTRNSLYQPHLRSAYLLETQGYRKGAEGVEGGDEPPRKKKVAPPAARPGLLAGIFRTPRGLVRRRREEERKKGAKRPHLKL